jgi:hypothetical protein
MISINWDTRDGGVCPTCNQPVTLKRKTLTLLGIIPIPLGSVTRTCGCGEAKKG